MKLIITTLTIIFISFNAFAEPYKKCLELKNEIQLNIYNYFENLTNKNLRKYKDSKERARKYLDTGSKLANIYNAICKE